MAYQVRVVHMPEKRLAVSEFRATASEIPQKMGSAFQSVAGYLARTGTPISGPAVARYETRGDRFDVAAGFQVASDFVGEGSVVPLVLPKGEFATVTHIGSYETLPLAYEALREGVEAQGRELDEAAPMWEEYFSPPETPPEQVKTVVLQPLKR